jgi:predicted dehydrogenase
MKSLLVGCGVGAEHHFASVRQLKDANFVGVCDTDIEKAKAAASKWGIRNTYSNFSEALRNEQPDVVHIVSPPATHLSIALNAMESGCHIMLEKPISITVDEADQIIEASKRKRVKLCMVHNHSYDPVILRAKELIKAGKIGDIIYVHVTYGISKKKGSKATGKRREWMESLPLGDFSEYSPHSVYLMLSFLENATVVGAVLKNRGVSANLPGGLNIQFAGDGASGNILVTKGLEYGEFSVRICGTKSALSINMYGLTMGIYRERNLPQTAARMFGTIEKGAMFLSSTGSNIIRVITGRLKKRPGHLNLIKAFYDSIRNDEEPPVPGEQGKAGVKVLQDVFKILNQSSQ